MAGKILVESWDHGMTTCKEKTSLADVDSLCAHVAAFRKMPTTGRLRVHVPGSLAYGHEEAIKALGVETF
jgi:hypothetical protein